MAWTSSSGTNVIDITVELSSQVGNDLVNLNSIPLSLTVGELKKKLNVPQNSRFGRLNKFENWDNRRTLSDYFVENDESFQCVIQCIAEDGQSSFDDYNEWVAANR